MTKAMFCTIQLLNKSYAIKCPEHEKDSLQLAAQKLNEHLLKKNSEFKKPDDFQTLLLAALHVSHELITCQTQHKEQREQLAQFISSLENKISQVAEATPSEISD